MVSFIVHLSILFLLVPLSIFFHELGHYLVAYYNNLNPSYGFDRRGFYVSHDQTDNITLKSNIILLGIVFGFFPGFCLMIGFDYVVYGLWLLGWAFANVREFKRYQYIKRGAI